MSGTAADVYQTVILHADAPAKPPPGAACNGCGICCAAEPCAVGVLLLRQRRGDCRALHWDAGARRYRCGFVVAPERHLPRMPGFLRPLVTLWARRAIAAGRGCDSDAQTL